MKTSKRFILFFALLFVSVLSILGQESVLYTEIQKAKASSVDFKSVSSVFTEATSVDRIADNFINKDNVYFFDYSSASLAGVSDAFTLVIPLKNKRWELELLEAHDDLDYTVITSDGQQRQADRSIKHFHGILKGVPNSIVDITYFGNELMGLICTDEGNFNIALDESSGKHLLFNDKNRKQKPVFECGTLDDGLADYDVDVLLQNVQESRAVAAGSNRYVKLYIEAEYDVYQSKGSSTESWIRGLMNQVGTLFSNDDIAVTLSTLYIWTNTDPYTATSTSALLTEFQNYRTSFSGDLGQLVTFRAIGGGKAAGFAGLCNASVAQKLSVAQLETTYNAVPSYSWSVYVVIHELGHLLGSRHTHACVWNGNNTAIDGCAEPEGSCARPGIPANGGTIMSYCHLQSVGINFNLGFGPQPGNLIRSNIANGSCLSTFSVSGPDNIPFNGSATYTLSVSLLSPKWSVTSGLSISYTSGNTAVIAATATTYTTAAISVNGIIVRTVTVGNMSSIAVGSGRQIAVSIAGETPATLPYLLVNRSGAVVAQGLIVSPGETLDFHAQPAGIYVLKVGEETHKVVLND